MQNIQHLLFEGGVLRIEQGHIDHANPRGIFIYIQRVSHLGNQLRKPRYQHLVYSLFPARRIISKRQGPSEVSRTLDVEMLPGQSSSTTKL